MALFKTLLGKLWFRVLLGLLLGIGFGFLVGSMTADGPLGMSGKDFLTQYIKPIGTRLVINTEDGSYMERAKD